MIPTEAARAAVKAAKESFGGEAPRGMRAAIHAALEAAAPYMLSLSAAEIEAVADMIKAAKAAGFDEGQKSGMRHADRLVAAAKIGKPELPGPISPNPYRSQP